MLWIKTDNPRVWQTSDGRYYAMAEETPNYSEGGYVGRVFARPLQMSFMESEPQRVGMSQWGGTPTAALRMTVRSYDPAAELPEKEDQVLP